MIDPNDLEYFKDLRRIHCIAESLEDEDLSEFEDKSEYAKEPNPIELYKHALMALKGRWPEAEPIIMESPWVAYYYARDIIKGRWPEAEPIIVNEPATAYHYARDVIKDRWPEAEPIIMEDPAMDAPYYAYIYAKDVIKDRWPEAEPRIMQDPYTVIAYAQDIIGGRWSEAEPIIMQDLHAAYLYAKDIIKGRWPEAEPRIIRSPIDTCLNYYGLFKEGERWPLLEKKLLKDKRIKLSTVLQYYIKAMIRIPPAHREIEQTALLFSKPLHLYKYAVNSIKRRWPEAEPEIRGTGIWPRYKKHFKIKD